MKQIAGVVEHCAGVVDGVFKRREGLAEFHLTKVVHERLDRREDDCLGIAEQAFVVFELLELVGERLNLLHLVADYLDELRDLLRGVRDGLSVESRIVNDPFRPRGHGDAECHERWRRRNNYEIIFADWDNPVFNELMESYKLSNRRGRSSSCCGTWRLPFRLLLHALRQRGQRHELQEC